MQIALYQPDIPQNLGSILRLCACLDVVCHIIEPCGFILDDKRLKRVAMDYAEQARWQRHVSWQQFHLWAREHKTRLVLLTTKATERHCDFTFHQGDIVLLGRESAGVPEEVAAIADVRLLIPLAANMRSLNIAQAASIALAEALRQTRWMPSPPQIP